MGVSGMFVGTVTVDGEKFYKFKLEFENQKRNLEIQNRKIINFVVKL